MSQLAQQMQNQLHPPILPGACLQCISDTQNNSKCSTNEEIPASACALPLLTVKKTKLVSLAQDYLQYVLQESHLGPAQTRVAHVLRSIASSLQDQTEEALRPLLDRIDITSVAVAKRIFNGVMEEKFADGNTNWGRIMTIFTFGGLLTKKLQEHGVQLTAEEKEQISYFITEYIINHKAEWIDANGGWENGFLTKFERRSLLSFSKITALFIAVFSLLREYY